MFPDFHSTLKASAALLAANIFAPPIVHVGVPGNAPRIRFFLSAAHEAHHLERAISVLRKPMYDGPVPSEAVFAEMVAAAKAKGR